MILLPHFIKIRYVASLDSKLQHFFGPVMSILFWKLHDVQPKTILFQLSLGEENIKTFPAVSGWGN